MPDLFGYEWKAGKSKHVIYISLGDLHLRELSTTGGSWQMADLTLLAGAPRPFFAWPIAYAWEAALSKHVLYVTEDRHIHELTLELGGQWSHVDLTALTGTPLPAPNPYRQFLWAYDWDAGKSRHIVYKTDDDHIHELSMDVWDGRWIHADLTQQSGAPVTGAIISAYAWEAGKSRQVAFSGYGQVHEVYATLGGPWKYANLSALTGAPNQTATIDAYAWEAGPSKQVVFRSEDGHIHELYVRAGGTWGHADLTTLTGSPVPFTVVNAYAWEAGKSKQVVFLGPDGHIHELWVTAGGKWSHADITVAAAAPKVCQTFVPIYAANELHGFAWETGHAKQVVFLTGAATGYHIHQVVTTGGPWTDADLSQLAGAPQASGACL